MVKSRDIFCHQPQFPLSVTVIIFTQIALYLSYFFRPRRKGIVVPLQWHEPFSPFMLITTSTSPDEKLCCSECSLVGSSVQHPISFHWPHVPGSNGMATHGGCPRQQALSVLVTNATSFAVPAIPWPNPAIACTILFDSCRRLRINGIDKSCADRLKVTNCRA